MKTYQPAVRELKNRLRQVLRDEWLANGFFPCYASVRLQGDPTFTFSDLLHFLRSRTDPFLRAASLVLWPFRLGQLVNRDPGDGLASRVPTEGLGTIRFHTFFTDAYFFSAVRQILADPGLPAEECLFWQEVQAGLVGQAWQSRRSISINGQSFAVWSFFPDEVAKGQTSARFLDWTGLRRIDPDADDTFVLLEMLAAARGLVEAERANGSMQTVDDWLNRPYWQLARRYQFGQGPEAAPDVNYTGIDPAGGVSTWFSRWPVDAPDLVVNLNLLRSLLANRQRWSLLDSEESLQVVTSLLDFLHTNVENGLFRRPRSYSFYIPEFFYAMFARTWSVFQTLDPCEQLYLDPQQHLDAIRRAVHKTLPIDLGPGPQRLNPLDAALGLETALRTGWDEPAFIEGWLDVLLQRQEPGPYPYQAYEIFKGKLPTHMIYGSQATTAALVLEALSVWEQEGSHAAG